MIVMAPSDQVQLHHMLHTALRQDGPVALRYPRGMAVRYAEPDELAELPIGRGVVLEQGVDVALVGIGTGVGIAREAATALRAKGLTPTLVDACFAKPIDGDLLDRLAGAHTLIVTVEENVLAGGFGSAVLEHFAGTGVRVECVGLPDRFIPHGDRERLLADAGLTAERVAAVALGVTAGAVRIS